MKILETKTAPNARRVRMFLAEKGVDIEYIQVDITQGENLSPDFRSKNPWGKVPVLELGDGTCIAESIAICRYFEETVPEPPLMGRDPLERAQIEMWQRRMEFSLMLSVGMAFQHLSGFFKDRMTPVKEWGEINKEAVSKLLAQLDHHLASSTYIAGEQFSVADITALCAIDFARVIDVRPTPEQTHLTRWHQQVSSRPSAKA
ncbi:glutathione S-transferase family protein [Aestuariirhabdus litorea]|uniref:Glutathione S-transferase family protein n=1 Tax=Aestuariirhabdus litorea TaxID=2528527 RepID=A0A3P3VJ64_9GAMM|nr:glutathione S-transferase family protein [Aestuariirhabdus litorea]RRJ82387.1 glutathione S-transferase family protein [Aestuariirhabdus litorea]RWW92550.1 glutathione S-transferase family protein [Endozoicomonadaceae bacterium GTF-13]